MKAGDVYIHADIHGASSTVLKNPSGRPISKKSLDEAGMFCICMSQAWNSKVVSAAWWVFHHQVSKTAPSGQYLPTGSFMIRGKKNYVNPGRLELNLVLLFKVSDESLARHVGERKVYEEPGAEMVQ